jgi:ankyrin repeat protein
MDLEALFDNAEEGYLIPCRRDDGTIDFHARAGNGDTLLHVAVGRRDFEAIRYFVEAGLDVNAKGDYHETPLYSAAAHKDIGLVGFLLQLGADPSVPDHQGDLPADVLFRKLKRLSEPCLLHLSKWMCAKCQDEPPENQNAEGGARQPTTAPDSKSKGEEKPKPESEERSQ